MQNIFLPPNGKGILCQDKSCLVLNTKGSARTLSQFALVHSSEGKFIRPQNPKHSLRLVSGGHGQKGMELLKKYGIAYNIVKIYPNGVRVGNVPDHREKRMGINQS